MTRIAMVGFEYSHHINALRIALNRLADTRQHYEPVLWTARDGVEASVLKTFPACTFLEAETAADELRRENRKLNPNNDINLTSLEIKHYSYTYSRSTYLRDPRNVTAVDMELFRSWLSFAQTLISTYGIDALLFVKMPHSLLDISLFFAAQRLGKKCCYTEGPVFGDYVFSNKFNNKKAMVNSVQVDRKLRSAFEQMMRQRDLRSNLLPPAYMDKTKLGYLPDIPTPMTTYFNTSIERKVFKTTASSLLTKVVRKMMETLTTVIRFYSKTVIRNFYLSKKLEYSKPYILVLLQFHPEQTTSISALDTPFEEERVKRLADKFKEIDIVVREHPSNLKGALFHQYRSLASLKEMTKAPNVSYFWPKSRQEYLLLLQGALCTVSTSGTVVFESIQLGVPSIHFSNSFASGMPGVINTKDVDHIDLEMINQSRKQLSSLTNEQICERSLGALVDRPICEAFFSGFHTSGYNSDKYEQDASVALFKFIDYHLGS